MLLDTRSLYPREKSPSKVVVYHKAQPIIIVNIVVILV